MAILLPLDLSSLDSIKQASAEFRKYDHRFILSLFMTSPIAWNLSCMFCSIMRKWSAYIISESAHKIGFRGVMASPNSFLTQDGYDLQFGVNVLGSQIVSERP